MRPPSLRSAPDRTALAGVGERPRVRTCRGTRPPPPRASGKEGAKTRLLADRRGCDPLSGGACHPHVVPAPQLDSCQRQPVASGHTGCLRPREARAQDHMTQRPRGGDGGNFRRGYSVLRGHSWREHGKGSSGL